MQLEPDARSSLPSDSGAPDDAARRLDELVFECLERLEREGPLALSELCHAHVELAPALLERVRSLAERGLVDVPTRELSAEDSNEAGGEAPRSARVDGV